MKSNIILTISSINYWQNRLKTPSTRRFFFYAFSFLLPLNQRISTLFIFVWLLHALLTYDKRYLFRDYKLLLLPLLYLVMICSLWYSTHFDFRFYEQKASLVVFPLLFYLNGNVITTHIKNILHAFVWGCVIAGFWLEFSALYAMLYDVIESKNHWMGTGFSTLHQTVYYAMYLCTACIILIFFPMKKQGINISLLLFFILLLIQISNRAGLLVFSLLSLFLIITKIPSLYLKISALILCFIGIVLLVWYVPRLHKTADNIINRRLNLSENTSEGLRLQAWQASISLIGEHPILGVGIGDAQDELDNRYLVLGHYLAARKHLNSHNNFMWIWLQTGVVGFVLFILYFINLYRIGRKQGALFSFFIAFIFIIAVNSLFESIFGRYSGIVFFSFMYGVFLLFEKPRTRIIEKKP